MLRERLVDWARHNQLLYSCYYLTEILPNIPWRGWRDKEKIRLFLTVKPYTLVNSAGLNCTYKLANFVEVKKIPGDFVECGVWRGGCASILAYVAQKFKSPRNVWLFDSFQGLPQPRKIDGMLAKKDARGKISGDLVPIGKDIASLADVEEILFQKFQFEKKSIRIVPGWFQETIPKTRKEINSIAILRLDADWHESTKICLDNLYDLIVPGGFIIIDDFAKWVGCRKAVLNFLKERDLEVSLRPVGSAGRFFQKPLFDSAKSIDKR